jgi:D-serine deaminase-like pyridoxal phosphate-dependent protein
MARKQVASGSEGLTVAKVGEARVMAQASNDIFMAYPGLDPTRTAALAELAKTKTVRVGIDSAYAVKALAAAAVAAGSTIGVLVDVDIGFHRTGVQTPQESLALAQLISTSKGLRLDGIMYYPGHAWLQGEPLAQEMARIQAAVKTVVDLWAQHGLKAPIVSGGSTPTMMASHLAPVTTEIRPGTYIYNDKNTLAGGYCKLEDCAAHIICTVVSNAVPGKCVIDGGTKTFTSDRLATDPNNGGFGLIVEYPDAKIVRFSEEHGEVDLSQCAQKPQLGERVHVIPNHICPCVNLQDSAWIKLPDGTIEPLKIEARGQLS